MRSHCRNAVLALAALVAGGCSAPRPAATPPVASRQLRVCADPNNLPFTNDRLEGFENRLAALVGRDLHADVRYTWCAQRRGFVRNTFNPVLCDGVIGV